MPVLSYWPEMGQSKPANTDGNLSFCGNYNFVQTRHVLKGRGITFLSTYRADELTPQGQEPATIETLLRVLGEYPLDRRFEAYGNFISKEPILVSGERMHGITSFFGNFFTLSHVFNIYTDDAEVVAKLTDAINANRKRKDYLAQPAPRLDKPSEFVMDGRYYVTRVVCNDETANKWLAKHPAWGVIGEDGRGVHLAKLRDKGRAVKMSAAATATPIDVQADPVRVAAYQRKQEARKERLEARADKLRKKADQHHKISHALVEHIPFGQPILVGHHSEKRHRRTLDRSWNHLGKAVEATKHADKLESRAASVGKAGISSDDPEAVVKLREKLANMEESQAYMGAVNAAWRKAKKPKANDVDGWTKVAEILGEPLRSLDQVRTSYARDFIDRSPFPPYALSNNSGNMKRVKDRLAHLERQHAQAQATNYAPKETEAPGGVRIVENLEANRLQIFFPGKPAAEIRTKLKQSGFRWSPSEGAWQRHLGNNAKWCAETVLGLK